MNKEASTVEYCWEEAGLYQYCIEFRHPHPLAGKVGIVQGQSYECCDMWVIFLVEGKEYKERLWGGTDFRFFTRDKEGRRVNFGD